jgi:hypothetical protein
MAEHVLRSLGKLLAFRQRQVVSGDGNAGAIS